MSVFFQLNTFDLANSLYSDDSSHDIAVFVLKREVNSTNQPTNRILTVVVYGLEPRIRPIAFLILFVCVLAVNYYSLALLHSACLSKLKINSLIIKPKIAHLITTPAHK